MKGCSKRPPFRLRQTTRTYLPSLSSRAMHSSPPPPQRHSAGVSPVCQSLSYWVNTAGYGSEAHGWSMFNRLFTRTLRFFHTELLLASLSAACSAAWTWTFHLSLLKFMQFPSAHSFSLLSTCQVAALPSSLLTAPLSGITHKLGKGPSIPSLQQTCHTVSVPVSIPWCNLGCIRYVILQFSNKSTLVAAAEHYIVSRSLCHWV